MKKYIESLTISHTKNMKMEKILNLRAQLTVETLMTFIQRNFRKVLTVADYSRHRRSKKCCLTEEEGESDFGIGQKTVFSRVYGYAVAAIIFIHFTVYIGMAIGLLPVIGIPLPFFSYGGSSLWGFTILLFIFIKLDAYKWDIW